MYRNLTLIVFLALSGVSCVTTGAQASSASIKQAIQAQYDRGNRALMAEDANGYAAICTPDAVFSVTNSAPITLKAELSHIGPNPDPDSIVSSTRESIQRLALNRSADTAEVDAETFDTGTLVDHDGSYGQKEMKHQWSLVSHTHDLWVRQRNIWRLKKSVTKTGSVFRLDGKVIPVSDSDFTP